MKIRKFRRRQNLYALTSKEVGNIMTDARVQSHGTATSLSLLERVRDRDQEAWNQLVELYAPMIYGWCLRAGLQPADAADVGQDVFLAVARAIGNFRRDRPKDSFRGWLRRITQRKIIDRKKAGRGITGIGGSDAQARINEIPTVDAEPEGGEEEFSESERVGILRQAIEGLRAEFEAQTLRIFLRCYLDEVAVADVAGEFKVTPNVVYLARSRVLHRLRERYRELISFGDRSIAEIGG